MEMGGDRMMGARRWEGFLLVGLLALAAGVGVIAPQVRAADMMTVNVQNATVMGQSQPILVDAKGSSLYYLTSDAMTTSACTGGCAGVWPPLLSSGMPTAPSAVPGKLAVVKTANGAQVSYNGHLLYRYAPDAKPGDVGGDGLHGPQNGVWHVATPALKPAM